MTTSPIVALDARLIGGRFTGDTTYWTGLLQGLMELNSDIQYLLYSNAPKPPEIPDNPRFRWIEVKSRNDRWWSFIKFPVMARRAGASVIHTQYNLSPLAGTCGITTIHDVSFFAEPEWFKPRDRVVLQRFVPASAHRSARIITVSEFSRSQIAKYMPTEKNRVRVTHLACSPNIRPMPLEEAKQVLWNELAVEQPFLLAVGTRWPRKNMALAIRAAELLPESVPHKLIVTGKSGWGEEKANDWSVFPGFVTDQQLSALYSAADLFLAPSLYEGFGITLLEAFTCGCPVLASPAEAHKEVAGDAAEIAKDWEPATWAEQIQTLLADSSKLSELRQKGERRAKDFSWLEMARQTENVYRELLT